MRSVLLVPARPDDLAAAIASGASVVIADLMLDVGSLDQRRGCVAAWLRQQRPIENRPGLYVGVHDLGSRSIDADIKALFPDTPDGVLLRRCRSGEDVQRLGVRLGVMEAEHDLVDGSVGILAVTAGTAEAVLALDTFPGASPRLRGLAWDGETLATDLSLSLYDPMSGEPAPLTYARALTLLVAKAAGVPALDAVAQVVNETTARILAQGRRDGFAGAVTSNIRHVPIIEAEYARAGNVRRVRTP